MADFNFVSGATRFGCTRCAKCCSLDVMLSDGEMERLDLNVDRQWRTTKKAWQGSRFCCILLERSSCAIYESRPKLCKVYPFLAVPASDFQKLGIKEPSPEEALKFSWNDGESYFIIYDDSCPGIGKGSFCEWESVIALTLGHQDDFKDVKINLP